MPTLLETQSIFFDTVLRAMPAQAAAFIAGDDETAPERLAVYRDTALGVLTTALRLTYPAVCRIVGEEFLEAAAEIFIAQAPPVSAYLNDYGAGFADFLAAFPPARPLSYLPAMAALEWAVNGALHALDAGSMSAARLSALSGLGHEHVRLVPHPSLRFLSATFPVELLWRAVLDDDDAALESFDFGAGQRWFLISRTKAHVEVVALSEVDWRFAKALAEGASLEQALNDTKPDDPAALLGAHFASGRFTDFTIAPSTENSDV